jgi:glycosyltransferase involved in cell wall biosynthesis
LKVIVNAVGYVGQSGGAGGAGVFLQYLIDQLGQRHALDVLTAQNSSGFRARQRSARFIELPHLTGETLRHLRDGPTVVIDPFGALPCWPYPEDMALCVVVHDLMHLERPHFFTPSERDGRSRSFAGGLQRADSVVTFSNDQARAIRRFYPGAVPTVIPHLPYAALNGHHAAAPEIDLSHYEPFLLFPAVKWPHKNHRTVIEAFGAYVERTNSPLRLILCGGPCAESRFSYYPAQDLISDRVVDLGLVSDDMLQALLHKANAILFPTLYEGFGIPVLEAAYSGKMVIASKLDVFDEILGAAGYRGIEEPKCHLRWMDAFADSEGDVRLQYEAASARTKKGVQVARFIERFEETLQASADRYVHPSLYPSRWFRGHDRATSSVVTALTFADIHGTAAGEHGPRHPAVGQTPSTRATAIYRSTDADVHRRVCLRSHYDVGPQINGAGSTAMFSAWIRLQGEPRVDQIRWSVNDGDVLDLLPDLQGGDWHLVRRAIPTAGFVDFRAVRDGIAEAVGFDIEIHDSCVVEVAPMAVPDVDPLPRGLTIYVDASAEMVEWPTITGFVTEINQALGSAHGKLHWVLIATRAVVGQATGHGVPANVRVQMVSRESFDRARAARLASPYDPVDQVLLLGAGDLEACLVPANLDILASALSPVRFASARKLSLAAAKPAGPQRPAAAAAKSANGRRPARGATAAHVWLDDERGVIIDARARIGRPVPLLDHEVIQNCLVVETASRKPRFAVIETDLVGGISHHSAVTGLFLDGAQACGFEPLLGLNRAARAAEEARTEQWSGFGAQVYSPGSADDFASELAAFTAAKKLGPDDVIFMHSLSPQILLGTARFIAGNIDRAPRFALRFFSTAEAMAGHKLSYTKVLRSILAVRAVREKMTFFCESANLVAYYKQATGIEFPLLFNPEHPALGLVRNSTWFDPNLGGGRQKTLAYFGEARAEKGFDLIPEIIESLLADPAMQEFHFLVQVGSNSQNQTPQMARAKSALFDLRSKHRARLRTFESADTPEEFYFLMKHATGVISPYSPDAYGTRGTGVTLEALQMGLDVFAWEETDLYATFRDTGRLIGVGSNEDFPTVIARHYRAPREPAGVGVDALRQTPAETCRRMMSLCQTETSAAARPAPPVLWVGNDTFGEGCSVVYASQKRALRDMGRDCLELFVPWPDRNWRGVEPSAYDTRLYGFDSQYECNGLGWVARPNFCAELDRVLAAIDSDGQTYARMRALNKYLVMPESLRHALTALAVDQTLLNYAHLYPLIAGIMPLERVVCETHDVVSYQHAVRRGDAVSLTEKIDEFSDLAKFPQVVAISASEQREMASACPATKVFWRLPPYVPEAASVGRLPQDAELLEALAADEPDLAAVIRPSAVMLGIYQSRGDLQACYDLSIPLGRLAFFRWWVLYGRLEYMEMFRLTPRQYGWLLGEPAAEGAPSLSGLLKLMLTVRRDVRRAFNGDGGVDVAKVQQWADEYADRELGISPATLRADAARHGAAAETGGKAAAAGAALDAVLEAQPAGAGGLPAEQQALFERIGGIDCIDMVLVGSSHPANIVSFNWFITKVYLPYLAPVGRNLFIAGSACALLPTAGRHNIFPLGRCKHIEPLLRAARSCPLPVVSGSGSPIKTIPALAANGAVTVTDHIERAFGLQAYGIPAFSDPRGFAEDIRTLLVDEKRRAARVESARRYVDDMLTVPSYVAFWRERLQTGAPFVG